MAFPVKAWLRFYFKLSLVEAWNGIIRFFYVLTGAGAVQVLKMADFTAMGWKGAGWLLLSTIAISVAGGLFKNPVPDPTPPAVE